LALVEIKGDSSPFTLLRSAHYPLLSIHKAGEYHKHILNKNKISVYDIYLKKFIPQAVAIHP
jgi:hypothetical protein